MYYMMLQFVVFSPLATAVLIASSYEHVAPERRAAVNTACLVINIASLMTVIYATKVILGIAETCEDVDTQAKQHRERTISHSGNLGASEKEESHVVNNLSPKNSWISVVTALPALAQIFVNLIVTEPLTYASGDVLPLEDRRVFWVAFVTVFINFLGAFMAKSAFAVDDTESSFVEMLASRAIEAERAPGYVLDHLMATYERIKQDRVARGIDVDFGKAPTGRTAAYMYGEQEDCPLPAHMTAAPGAAPGDVAVQLPTSSGGNSV